MERGLFDSDELILAQLAYYANAEEVVPSPLQILCAGSVTMAVIQLRQPPH